jgi:uncharacterized protein YjbI with pentapeptide repeats
MKRLNRTKWPTEWPSPHAILRGFFLAVIMYSLIMLIAKGIENSFPAANWNTVGAFIGMITLGPIFWAISRYQRVAEDQRKTKHYQAWRAITDAQGKSGSGGRKTALEELHSDGENLVGVDLSKNAYLDCLELPLANLYRANLESADLWLANFKGTTLSHANLKDADLGHANLEGADLRDANLEGADLRGANLEGAILEGANLEGAILEGANLKSAVLNHASLKGAILEDANLEGAILENVDFERSFLWLTNFKGANLRNANLKCTRLDLTDLKDADLGHANLEGAGLKGAGLEGASLENAYLKNALLENANLKGANLNRANLEGAVLRRANLTGTTGLIRTQVLSSRYWGGAELPDDLKVLEQPKDTSEEDLDRLGRTWRPEVDTEKDTN